MSKGKGGAFSSLGRARVLEIFPFPLKKKKTGIFYAGCNNQFALGKGIQQSQILSGFQVLVFSYNHQWDSGFLELYSRFQRTGFQISQANVSRIPDQQAKFPQIPPFRFSYMWRNQRNTSKLY